MSEIDDLKIGVWIEDGIVFRRDSKKQPYPRKYKPKKEGLLEELFSAIKSLHNFALLPSWTAQIESQANQEVEKINKLIVH